MSPTIFDPIPWQAVGISVFQTFVLYWLLMFGIRFAGRRVFGQLGPQDLVVLILIAEACNLGLTQEEGGFWATLGSVLTILLTGTIIERIPALQNFVEGQPIDLMKDGEILPDVMKKWLVQETDLHGAARKYGYDDFNVFEKMTMESDGSITGVFKREYRQYIPPVHHDKERI